MSDHKKDPCRQYRPPRSDVAEYAKVCKNGKIVTTVRVNFEDGKEQEHLTGIAIWAKQQREKAKG